MKLSVRIISESMSRIELLEDMVKDEVITFDEFERLIRLELSQMRRAREHAENYEKTLTE